MFQWIKEKAYAFWDGLKAWFKRSETIFVARIAAFSGVITATVGMFDWSPLWMFLSTGTEFTSKQLITIGISIVGAGVMLEAARRRNTVTLKDGSISTKK